MDAVIEMQDAEGGIDGEWLQELCAVVRKIGGDCEVPSDGGNPSEIQLFVRECCSQLQARFDPSPTATRLKHTQALLRKAQRDRDRLQVDSDRLTEENAKLHRALKKAAIFDDQGPEPSDANQSKFGQLLMLNALKKALVDKDREFQEVLEAKERELQQLRESAVVEEEFQQETAVVEEPLVASECRVETETFTEETQVEGLVTFCDVEVQTEKLGKKKVQKSTQTSSLYLLKAPSDQCHTSIQTDSSYFQTASQSTTAYLSPPTAEFELQCSPSVLHQFTETEVISTLASTVQTPPLPISLGKSTQTDRSDTDFQALPAVDISPITKRVSEVSLSETKVSWHSPSERAYKRLYQEKSRECDDLRALLFRPRQTGSPGLSLSKSTLRLRFEDIKPQLSPRSGRFSELSPVGRVDTSPLSDMSVLDSLAQGLRTKEREVLQREQKVRRKEMLLLGQVKDRTLWREAVTDR